MKSLAMPVLYVFSIVLAVGIGAYQAGAVGNPELQLGSGGPGCNYKGYSDPTCFSNVSGCSLGTYKKVNSGTTDQEDYRDDGSTSARRGNCTGTGNCTTPLSIGLSSGPCGG